MVSGIAVGHIHVPIYGSATREVTAAQCPPFPQWAAATKREEPDQTLLVILFYKFLSTSLLVSSNELQVKGIKYIIFPINSLGTPSFFELFLRSKKPVERGGV